MGYLCGDVAGMVYRSVEVRVSAGGAEKWRIRRGGCHFLPPPPRQSKYFLYGWKLNNVNNHGTVENVYISQDIKNDY